MRPEGVPHSIVGSTYYSLHYHVVFATKERRALINAEWMPKLHGYLGGTIKGLGGVALAIGGVQDHVHLLIGLKTTHCISDFMRDLKTRSSVWTQETLRDDFSWQEGYAVFASGHSALPGVVAYINTQEQHHRHESSADELHRILMEEGIDFDERYFV